jgi:glutamate:GABA antiporter
MSRDSPAPRLRATLRFRDVVLFLIVAVISPRWIATAAAVGPSAVIVWAIAFAAFFVPLAFTVLDLSARHPEEGGIYVWARRAFGDFAGFMTAWTYWTSNLVYFPALLYFTAGNALYAAGPGALALSNSAPYFITASLVGLAVALGLNIVGLDVGKWLHNLGALGTWAPIAILVAAGAIAIARFGSATSFAPAALVPGTRLPDLVLWSTIAFAFAGLEAASFMGEEIRDAKRTLPRAVLAAGAWITAIYLLGTIAVMVAVPREQVSGLQGIMQAIATVAERAGLRGLTPLVAILITVGGVGSVGAWLASVARLPYVAGIDHFLPPAFGRLHPKWGTPYVGLLVQTAGAAVFVILGQAGTSVRGAYDALNSMALIVYFVPYLIMFAAAIRLRGERTVEGTAPSRGRRTATVFLAALGFATTAGSIVLALLPSEGGGNPAAQVIRVVGLSGLLIASGAALYWNARRRTR